jgi:hypothetical protein
MEIKGKRLRNVLAENKILNGKYIIGLDPISNTSKGAIVVAKHTDKGIEIINRTRTSKYHWINKIKFKWTAWMLCLKYFRNITIVREKTCYSPHSIHPLIKGGGE